MIDIEINETFFITESDKYIFFEADNKIFKLDKKIYKRELFDIIIKDVYEKKNVDRSNLFFQFLFKINAIKVIETSTENKISICSDKSLLSKMIIDIINSDSEYSNVFSLNDYTGIYLKLVNDGKLLVYTSAEIQLNKLDWDLDKEYNEFFVKYLLEILIYRKKEIENLKKSEILIIDTDLYTNEVKKINYSDNSMFDYCLIEGLYTIKFDLERYYPLIQLKYSNILGQKAVIFGINKNQCLLNFKNRYHGESNNSSYTYSLEELKIIINYYFKNMDNSEIEEVMKSLTNEGQLFEFYFEKNGK